MLQLKELKTGFLNSEKVPQVLTQLPEIQFENQGLCALIGRNGTGKSTLLKTLAGLIPPLSGEVLWQNQNLHQLSISQRASYVSMVMSNAPQMSMFGVMDMLFTAISGQLSPFKKIPEHIHQNALACLKTCGMAGYENRNFAVLSDGEKQKVMIARCLLQNTPLMLLDEPLAFLDYPSKKEITQLLFEISKTQNKLILITSHDLEHTLQFADSVLLLKSDTTAQFWNDKNQINQLNFTSLFNQFDPQTVSI